MKTSLWKQALLHNDKGEISRVIEELFISPQTIDFLRALHEVSISSAKLGHPSLVRAQVRNKLRALELDELGRSLDILMNLPDGAQLATLVLGSPPNESGPGPARLMVKLLMLHRRQFVCVKGTICSAHWAIVILLQAAGQRAGHTWTNALYHAMESGDEELLPLFVERIFGFGECVYRLIPYSNVEQPFKVTANDGVASLTYQVPVPDDLLQWAGYRIRRSLRLLMEREKGLTRLVKEFQERKEAFCSSYENMWLEMMLEPRWHLREGGLDKVELAIPELRTAGIRSMRFTPLEPFPKFRLTIFRTLAKDYSHEVEVELEPSDLQQIHFGDLPDDHLLTWVDRFYAFLAVQAVWRIVMGHLSSPAIPSRSGVSARASGSVVRPRFRRLPKGYKASTEARVRALETFRREPLPGFTFVRQYSYGQADNSGEPLFLITEIKLV